MPSACFLLLHCERRARPLQQPVISRQCELGIFVKMLKSLRHNTLTGYPVHLKPALALLAYLRQYRPD